MHHHSFKLTTLQENLTHSFTDATRPYLGPDFTSSYPEHGGHAEREGVLSQGRANSSANARETMHPRVAQMIAEFYKLTIGDDRLTKIALANMTGTSSRDESLEFRSYLLMARNRCRQQRSDSIASQQSRLLTLPAELRNTIYRLALVNEDPVTISPEAIGPFTPLLQTGRQIKTEASGIFYAENTFTTTASRPGPATFQAAAWLHSLNPTDVSTIIRLRVRYILPRSSIRDLGEAEKWWAAGALELAAHSLSLIMSQQEKNATTFLGSVDDMELDLKCVEGAEHIAFADGKLHDHMPAHFGDFLSESWKMAIRKRADKDLRKEIENATLEKSDGWTA